MFSRQQFLYRQTATARQQSPPLANTFNDEYYIPSPLPKIGK